MYDTPDGVRALSLQHVEFVLAGAHDVHADDVRVNVAGRPEIDHLRDERLVVRDQVLRHDARAHDFLAVVDVVEERVERHHALLDAERQPAPFGARDDARDDVERNQPLGGLRVAVDGERNARLAEHAFRVVGLLGEARGILRVEPLLQARVGRPYHVAGLQHFIEWLHRSFLHRSFSPALRMPDRRNECFARNVPCAIPRYPPFCAAPGTPARHCAPSRCSVRRDGRRRCVAGAHGSCCAASFEHSSPRVTSVQSALHKRPAPASATGTKEWEGGPARARRNRPWEVPFAAAPAVRRDELSG